MNRLLRTSALAVSTLIFSLGCASSLEYGTTYDPLTDFPEFATFVWDDDASSLPDDDPLRALDLDTAVKKVVGEEFAARGYNKAVAGTGDFRLSYDVSVHTWIDAGSFAMGSLALLLVDVRSMRRVWKGAGRTEFDLTLNRAQREKRLRKAVREMLAEFPPSQPNRQESS